MAHPGLGLLIGMSRHRGILRYMDDDIGGLTAMTPMDHGWLCLYRISCLHGLVDGDSIIAFVKYQALCWI